MLPDGLRVLYLHGFASSPGSRKATFFAHKLRERGARVDIPDLAEGCFERLTITRQLALIERLLAGEPAVLIGSSLGGYLAALYAAGHPEIERLILLAPAFDFYRLWSEDLGPERLAKWQRDGSIPVFHYGYRCEQPLGFEFFEDAARHEPFPDFGQPALVIHGDRDDVVPLELSARFAAAHPNARLTRLPSGHELTDVLEPIWRESAAFLALKKAVSGC